MSKEKTVLHEIIAVESSKEQVAKNMLEEAFGTFRKKTELFRGHSKTFTPIFPDEPEQADEVTIVSETVPSKLDYVFGHLANYYDLILQKDSTNQNARADLVVDGEVIAEDLPATFLLSMESKLKAVRELIASVPTLTPNIRWIKDENSGKDIYVTERPVEKNKTRRVTEAQVLVPATKEFPAQIEKMQSDIVVGKFEEMTWSSAITPARKSELLERTDNLILACKTARQRANLTEVNLRKVGSDIFKHITK